MLERGVLPAPRALPVSRLSYSGLEAYRRCGYRFYLQRALGLGTVDPPPAAQLAGDESAMSGLLRGSIVHGLLERIDFERPVVPPESEVARRLESTGHLPARRRWPIYAVWSSASSRRGSRERIAAGRVRAEVPFALR